MLMNRLRITRSVIPNLFTSLNMFCGFFSIINASQGNYVYAGWLIIIAAIFDALDGAVARLTNSSSEFGVELDSLSDVVSFGVAPSFLLFSTYYYEFGGLGIFLTSLPMIAGGYRLARFNVQVVGFEKSYFTGLPIPSSAIVIVSFVLSFFDGGYSLPHSNFIIPMTILLAILMVSKVRYESIPQVSVKSIKEKPFLFGFMLLGAVGFIIYGMVGVFYWFVFMIAIGIFKYVYNLFKTKKV